MLNALTDFDGLLIERISSPSEELSGFKTTNVYNVHGIVKKSQNSTQTVPLAVPPSTPAVAYSLSPQTSFTSPYIPPQIPQFPQIIPNPQIVQTPQLFQPPQMMQTPQILQPAYMPTVPYIMQTPATPMFPPPPYYGSMYIPPSLGPSSGHFVPTPGREEISLPSKFDNFTVTHKNLFEVQLTEKPRKAWDGDKDKDYFIRTTKHNLVFIIEQPASKFRKKILVYDDKRELLGSVKKKFGIFTANLSMYDQYTDPVLYARGLKFPTWHKMRVKDNNITRAKSKVKYTTPGEFYWSANNFWELLTNGEKSFVVSFPYWTDVQERSLIFAAALFADGIWY